MSHSDTIGGEVLVGNFCEYAANIELEEVERIFKRPSYLLSQHYLSSSTQVYNVILIVLYCSSPQCSKFNFATGKEQQDANEFFTHLTTLMDRCHHSPDDLNPADCLMFTVEERWECGSSGKVRYVSRTEDYLPLPIELGDSVNKEAVADFERAKKEREERGERVEEKDKVRAVIPLESCLERLCQEEQVRLSTRD